MERIHTLMDRIETKTGKCFHEAYPEAFESYKLVADGKRKPSFLIETLNKIIDTLS